MIKYVVLVVFKNCEDFGFAEYSGVEHKTKREAMHELAIAKTDSSVAWAKIFEREVIT